MKQKFIRLSRQYVAALRKYLKEGPPASLPPALKLGRKAVALGLETLDLARIHEQALAELEVSAAKRGFTKLARIFFIEANTPIVATHRAARRTQADLNQLKKSLGECTVELAGRNQQLQAGVRQQKLMQADFAQSGKHHHQCLAESLQLQKLLRELTHQALTAREEDRTKLSHELQDEIAQTLVGINVRLLALKQHDGHNCKSLKNEIASAQRLVQKSAKSVRQFARELHTPLGQRQTISPQARLNRLGRSSAARARTSQP